MSRIQLSTDLKTRTGAPDKDARLRNSYVEGKGDPTQPTYQSVVRKRPQAQGGIVTGSGIAQGGIGFSIAGVPYFIGVFGDAANGSALTGGSTAITPYGASVGTNWNAGATYAAGQMVSYNFVDYWAIDDVEQNPTPNINNDPTTTPTRWIKTKTSCVSPVIPAPIVLGTSQSYTENPTPPADVTLSDISMGYFCIGQLRKKVVIHYTIGAGASTSKVSGPGYDYVSHIGYGSTVAIAANDWFSQLIYGANSCPGRPVYFLWLQSISSISDLVYCDAWTTNSGGQPNVLPCPGVSAGPVGAGTISTVTAYLLTATTTESYYLI